MKSYIRELFSTFKPAATVAAEARAEKAAELLEMRLPELVERCRYTERVFEETMASHPAARPLLRMWHVAGDRERASLEEQMRAVSRPYPHMQDVFRLLDDARAQLAIAECASASSRRVA